MKSVTVGERPGLARATSRRVRAGTLLAMTPRQRAVLIALGAVSAVLLVVTLVIAGRGPDRTDVASGGGSSTTSTSEVTDVGPTFALRPVTPAPPTTGVPPAANPGPPPSAAVAPTTTLPSVTGEGAVLERARVAPSRTMGAACSSLADPGWTSTSCGTARAAGGDLTWVISSGPNSRGRRAHVWRRGSSAGEWVLALEARDDNGTRFASIAAKVADVSGDGKDDIAFGFRGTGNAAELAIDVVDGRGGVPEVTLHRDALRGSARVPSGELEVWAGKPQGNEPACCPSTYEHSTYRFVDGAWRVVARETVPASQVPPSQL